MSSQSCTAKSKDPVRYHFYNQKRQRQNSYLNCTRDIKLIFKNKVTEIYLSISAACFAKVCVLQAMISLHIHPKHATTKFTVLSIIFIDAHNFTHSEFPSLALNELLKDYLIAQLQSFWNSLKKSVPRTKPKLTARKQKRQLK